jgi:hypothetical protein
VLPILLTPPSGPGELCSLPEMKMTEQTKQVGLFVEAKVTRLGGASEVRPIAGLHSTARTYSSCSSRGTSSPWIRVWPRSLSSPTPRSAELSLAVVDELGYQKNRQSRTKGCGSPGGRNKPPAPTLFPKLKLRSSLSHEPRGQLD